MPETSGLQGKAGIFCRTGQGLGAAIAACLAQPLQTASQPGGDSGN